MEKSNQYYCHTCSKDFKYSPLNHDDEVPCPICKDTFVEQIEDDSQLEEAKASVPIERSKSSSEEFFDCNTETPTKDSKEEEKKEEPKPKYNQEEEKKEAQQNNQQNPNQPFTGTQSQTYTSDNANIEGDLNDDQLSDEGQQEGEGQDEQDMILDINIQQEIDLDDNNGQQNNQDQQHNQDQNQNQQNQQQFQQNPLGQALFGNLNNLISQLQGNMNQFNQQQQQQQQQNPGFQQQQFNMGFPINYGNLGAFNFQNLLGGFNNNLEQYEQNILNQVIQESLNQQQRTIPTSKSFIEKLRILRGSDLMNKQECQICQDTFNDEDKIIKLPCKHLFHKDCVMPWLEKTNTCPTCRYELPTDDLEYEDRKKRQNQGQNPLDGI